MLHSHSPCSSCHKLQSVLFAQEGLSIPGPAGALQRAQAAGLQAPHLHELGLQSYSTVTASQQQAYQDMHPDFLSPAWQSAMEALDLPCFAGKHDVQLTRSVVACCWLLQLVSTELAFML